MKIKEALRDYFMRVSGAEREILEMEAREENARRDLARVVREAKAVHGMRMNYLATILTGRISPLDSGSLKKLGINKALIRVGRERFCDVEKLGEEVKRLREMYFSYVAETVCEGEKTKRVPVMVYSGGNVVYANEKFMKRFPSRYLLGNSLRENWRLNVALNWGDGFEIKSEGGELVFVPRTRRTGAINVAYFLPDEDRLKKKAAAFRKRNEGVVRYIYDMLVKHEVELA
ncbi:MAG: hypothetical protein V1889_00885 [archaeon]